MNRTTVTKLSHFKNIGLEQSKKKKKTTSIICPLHCHAQLDTTLKHDKKFKNHEKNSPVNFKVQLLIHRFEATFLRFKKYLRGWLMEMGNNFPLIKRILSGDFMFLWLNLILKSMIWFSSGKWKRKFCNLFPCVCQESNAVVAKKE